MTAIKKKKINRVLHGPSRSTDSCNGVTDEFAEDGCYGIIEHSVVMEALGLYDNSYESLLEGSLIKGDFTKRHLIENGTY